MKCLLLFLVQVVLSISYADELPHIRALENHFAIEPTATFAQQYNICNFAYYSGGAIVRVYPSATVESVTISPKESKLKIYGDIVILKDKESESFVKGSPITLSTKQIIQFFAEGKDDAQIIVYGLDHLIREIIPLKKADQGAATKP